VTLDREDVEAVAVRVVELLEERAMPRSAGLVSARVLAARLGVSRDFVYAHAAELGVRRVGSGPRPRLLFDLDSCLTIRSSEMLEPARAQGSARSRRRSAGSGVALLPVRGVDRA